MEGDGEPVADLSRLRARKRFTMAEYAQAKAASRRIFESGGPLSSKPPGTECRPIVQSQARTETSGQIQTSDTVIRLPVLKANGSGQVVAQSAIPNLTQNVASRKKAAVHPPADGPADSASNLGSGEKLPIAVSDQAPSRTAAGAVTSANAPRRRGRPPGPPKPAKVSNPKPAKVSNPKPAKVSNPKPAKASNPKPAKVSNPKSAKVSNPKPAKISDPRNGPDAESREQGRVDHAQDLDATTAVPGKEWDGVQSQAGDGRADGDDRIRTSDITEAAPSRYGAGPIDADASKSVRVGRPGRKGTSNTGDEGTKKAPWHGKRRRCNVDVDNLDLETILGRNLDDYARKQEFHRMLHRQRDQFEKARSERVAARNQRRRVASENNDCSDTSLASNHEGEHAVSSKEHPTNFHGGDTSLAYETSQIAEASNSLELDVVEVSAGVEIVENRDVVAEKADETRLLRENAPSADEIQRNSNVSCAPDEPTKNVLESEQVNEQETSNQDASCSIPLEMMETAVEADVVNAGPDARPYVEFAVNGDAVNVSSLDKEFTEDGLWGLDKSSADKSSTGVGSAFERELTDNHRQSSVPKIT